MRGGALARCRKENSHETTKCVSPDRLVTVHHQQVAVPGHAPAPQPVTLSTALLRRRWRADHALMRRFLQRIDHTDGAVMRWCAAEYPARSTDSVMSRILGVSLAID
ncbi:hypothetical protein, partial [Microbacterium sp.]|uniref:hypothetical protein n=1 Tax=Microbacterium sp. TaxID=51671 RepID=UPI003A8B8756